MWQIRKIVSKGEYDYAVVPEHPCALPIGHYVLAHRVNMENYLGRLLEDGEIVHHVDDDKKHNEIENLELCLDVVHAKYHRRGGRTFVTLVCGFCGIEFQRELRQVKKSVKNHYCCRKHMHRKKGSIA